MRLRSELTKYCWKSREHVLQCPFAGDATVFTAKIGENDLRGMWALAVYLCQSPQQPIHVYILASLRFMTRVSRHNKLENWLLNKLCNVLCGFCISVEVGHWYRFVNLCRPISSRVHWLDCLSAHVICHTLRWRLIGQQRCNRCVSACVIAGGELSHSAVINSFLHDVLTANDKL